MVTNGKKRIGDILLDSGYVTTVEMEAALEAQRTTHKGEKLGNVFVDLGILTDRQLTHALENQLGYPTIHLSRFRIPDEIIALADQDIYRKYNLIPFGYSEKSSNILNVAMSDPLDIRAIDDISFITGLQIDIYISTERDISATIDRYCGGEQALKVAEQFTKERADAAKDKVVEESSDEGVENAPIVKLVKQLIEHAVHKRTSDIHIEPMENKLRIRYRVDGVLQEEMSHDISLHPAMIARIKIISGLDIAEKRKPQDGRATAIVDGQEFDIRVSLLPTVYGEKVVMRLAEKKALTKDKKDLGFPPEELEKFDKILSHPNGIILVTGPTGSGKSTTLYTALSELNTSGVNIITVEDPVEANIPGVNQVQVNEKAGLTFSSALRSILRQDPDIIMIGEIRDQETAQIAVKASITGHLVVSTLHTNSAASTIARLSDMGVENYLIGDSVVGVIAQRLVRRVCPVCSTYHEATSEELDILGIADKTKKIQIKGVNHTDCVKCNGNGYFGRIGIYEIMPVTPSLKRLISKGVTADELEKAAMEQGMKTLRQEAINYVLEGITTTSEVTRITYED